MTIALAAIETDSFLLEAFALAVAGIGVTILVYGSVALIVKADDIWPAHGRRGADPTAAGRWAAFIVAGMPTLPCGP